MPDPSKMGKGRRRGGVIGRYRSLMAIAVVAPEAGRKIRSNALKSLISRKENEA